MELYQSNYIKIAAAAAMLVDHIGAVLFPDIILLRMIGRIAFPLFAYQLGTGYIHTKNFKGYFLRLLLFGAAIQLVYSLAVVFFRLDLPPGSLNIFFTLALGLFCIYCFDKKIYSYIPAALLVPSVLWHFGISMDYGTYGVLMILLFFVFRNSVFSLSAALIVLSIIYCAFFQSFIQMFCIISIFFIAKPLRVRLRIPGRAFYLFYPVHLAVLHMVKQAIK